MTNRAIWLFSTILISFTSLFSLSIFIQPAYAADLTVGVTAGCGTIQACIDIANPGDTVIIPVGVYVESLTLHKAVSLVGAGVDDTVVRAASLQRTLTISGASIGNGVQITGIRLQNGNVSGGNICHVNGTANCGGGVLITGEAAPTLSNLIIRNNSAYRGGGLYVNEGSILPVIDNVILFRNSSTSSGGGAYLAEAITFQNGAVSENESVANVAGGLLLRGDSVIDNTEFLSNTANCQSGFGICHAGALYGFEIDLTIRDSYFANNHCLDLFDFDCDGGAVYWSRSFNGPYDIELDNNDFEGNSAQRNGGGVYLGGQFFDSFVVNSGRFEGNTAVTGEGGGIIAPKIEISGTHFYTNSAGGYNGSFSDGGGAVSVQYTTTVTNAWFFGNHSEDRGGAIQTFLGPVTIIGSHFEQNLARDNGGAVQVAIAGATIRDSHFEANRTYTTTSSTAYGNGGALHLSGDLWLENTDVISNTTYRYGGGVFVATGEVVVDNGRFERNVSQKTLTFTEGGGGLFVAGGVSQAIISNSLFMSNVVQAVGGGMVSFAPLSLDNTQFIGNTSLNTNSSGGGLYANNVVTATNVDFISNRTTDFGGGAYLREISWLDNVVFAHNESVEFSGGGLYATENLLLNETQFLTNTADLSGGGLYAGGITTMTNSLVQGNVSQGSGGGIGGSFDPLTAVNVEFVGNTAVLNGGGLLRNGNIFMTDTVFYQNQATTGRGGGLYSSGSIFFTNVDLTENRAYLDGGGAYINSNATLNGGTFSQNESVMGSGGGLYNWSQLTAVATQFLSNTAYLNGGGLHNNFRAYLTDVWVQNNTAQLSGGGISIFRQAEISTSQIISNQAQIGGGIAISGTSTSSTPNYIVNTLLANNHATSSADALYHDLGRTVHMVHTTIANPIQTNNQAVYVTDGTVLVTNTIIVSHAVGIEVGGTGVVTATHVNYFNNGSDEIGFTSANSILGDPQFYAANDYRLAENSPALNIGLDLDIHVDIRDAVRPQGGGYDIGAFETDYFELKVTVLGYSGTVLGTGISCGDDCVEEFIEGTVVTLTIAAETVFAFIRWEGDCADAIVCIVDMSEARDVTAQFATSFNFMPFVAKGED